MGTKDTELCIGYDRCIGYKVEDSSSTANPYFTKRPSIETFIENFKRGHDINAIIETFTNGNCYHFATILHNIYPEGRIVYDPIEGHFALKLWNGCFDITGEISLEHTPLYYMDEKCNDGFLYERLLRDCVYKLDWEEGDYEQ